MYDPNFSTLANEMGNTTSEKEVIDALCEWIGGIENAISNGETTCDELGFHTIDDIETAGNDMVVSSFDKRTLGHVTPERLSEFVEYFADSFEYADELDNATSPEANNDKESTMTASTASTASTTNSNSNAFYGSAASMSYEDFVDGMFIFANGWNGDIAIDLISTRVESLYNDVAFRSLISEYRRLCYDRRDAKKRMFESIAAGDVVPDKDGWANARIWDDYGKESLQAYTEVIYDMLVTLPRRAKTERESASREPRWANESLSSGTVVSE